MKQTGRCPKCGSSEIITDATPIDHVQLSPRQMSIATFRKQAFVFKEKQATTVSAWVCEDCGYVEFYADHPKKIRLHKA